MTLKYQFDLALSRGQGDFVARIRFTLHIDSKERDALADLSKIEGRPINQLVNEAIRGYLLRRGQKECVLESNMGRLRVHQQKDPGFRKAVAEFAGAEASLGDPLEGEIVDMRSAVQGPVQSRIRELLDVS